MVDARENGRHIDIDSVSRGRKPKKVTLQTDPLTKEAPLSDIAGSLPETTLEQLETSRYAEVVCRTPREKKEKPVSEKPKNVSLFVRRNP